MESARRADRSAGSREHRVRGLTGARARRPWPPPSCRRSGSGPRLRLPSNTLNSFASLTWLCRQSSSGCSALADRRIRRPDAKSALQPVCVRSIGSSTVPIDGERAAACRAGEHRAGVAADVLKVVLGQARMGFAGLGDDAHRDRHALRDADAGRRRSYAAALARRRPPARACAPPGGRRWRCARR